MTTGRVDANRANAAKSTGPRTAEGKRRSAQNSRRHGLSTPLAADPRFAKQLDQLARVIAGEGASAERLALARPIAEAQLDLVRIKWARRQLLTQRLEDTDGKLDRSEQRRRRAAAKLLFTTMPEQMARMVAKCMVPEDRRQDRLVSLSSTTTRQMLRLHRYERRALSRRKFAIRAFDEACCVSDRE